MSGRVPDRIAWAIEILDPRPADRVLELGSGPGVAAALVCERLTTGVLVAVDRSAVAVRRTRERNARHVSDGRLIVHHGTLADAGLADGGVDRAVAVDVNDFWTSGAQAEMEVLARVLRPGAPLYVLYGSGPTSADRILGPAGGALRRHGFSDVATVTGWGGVGVVGRAPAAIG